MKPKCLLLGSHSNRMPLAYGVYRAEFAKYVEFVGVHACPDLLVFGLHSDFEECVSEIGVFKARNPYLKVVVLSEEPFWDTVRYECFTDWKHHYASEALDLEFYFLNHFTTSIYAFECLPYFITTDDNFFTRYSYKFNRNAKLRPNEVLEIWNKASVSAAFLARKRLSEKYDFSYSEIDVYGLSHYRSKLTELYPSQGSLKVGFGWGGAKVLRQDLSDWHLDKLAMLDKSCLFVSALENTHQYDYISEKLFDAFAVLSVPLYWASSGHRSHEVFGEAFVNLFGEDVDAAVRFLEGFEVSDAFLESYCGTQGFLASLFGSARSLIAERKRVVSAVVSELHKVLES